MSNVIMNDTGNGFIKDYTHNLKLVIPYFDIATWHDYIEYNFDRLDAVINHIYKIVGFVGEWKKTTTYNAEEIVYINDKNSQYYTKLAKILVRHTTDTNDFDTFYSEHQDYYEIYTENIQTNGIRIVNINNSYTVNPQENITIDLSQYTYPNKNYYCVVNFDNLVDLTTISSYCYYTNNTQSLVIQTHNTQPMTVLVNFVLLIPIDKSFDSTDFVYGYTNGLYMQDKLVKSSELSQEIGRVINLIPEVYDSTINIYQRDNLVGSFTLNQDHDGRIDLVGGGDDTIIIDRLACTIPLGSTYEYMDVTSYVDLNKNYFPVVRFIGNDQQTEPTRNNYCSYCQYRRNANHTSAKIKMFKADANDFVSAYFQIILIPLNDNTLNITDGITDGYANLSLKNKQDKSNLVTSISSQSTDNEYPSAKCVYDIVGDIENILHSINSGSSSDSLVNQLYEASNTLSGIINSSDNRQDMSDQEVFDTAEQQLENFIGEDE